MKLTKHQRLSLGLSCVLAILVVAGQALSGLRALAATVSTTTVQGTVYLANGQPGTGTLEVSWPSFTTSLNQAVAAGRLTVSIAADGFVSVNLAPNVGTTPAGQYYTAVYYLSDGTTNTEYWQVPAAAQATIGQVRVKVMPAAQAVQAVSKAYVDQVVAELQAGEILVGGGTMTGPLILNGDPKVPLQAATKHYVDAQVSTAVPLTGGAMIGSLTSPAVNGVTSPTAGSSQTTLQSAVDAAGTSGAVEIPPTYAGTDRFSNAHGVVVMDLRSSGSQGTARSVKEFGAVCDGTTDDTSALQSALDYAKAHGVALTIPQGTCKTHRLTWRGESIGGLGKQVSALKGYAGEDVLASPVDSTGILASTRLHDLTIYVDQSVDASCSGAKGRAAAGSCAVSRPVETGSIFSPGGNGLSGTKGSGAAWWVGNCAIAMPASTGAGGNGLKAATVENVRIAATGSDPLQEYAGAHSTHSCGFYLAQWPQGSEFRNIEIEGVNTGIAMPALAGTVPAGLTAEANRWQKIALTATHGFTASAGSNNVLEDVVVEAESSPATAETPTGVVLDLSGDESGWSVRGGVVRARWYAVPATLTVTSAGGAVTAVSVGSEHGLGFDPYGASVPIAFSGSCTAQATAQVNSDGSIGAVTVTSGGSGCSGTTTASVNADGKWDTASAVNLISGKETSMAGGNLQRGSGGYTVWNASGSQSAGTEWGGGGTLPGGAGSYPGVVALTGMGVSNQADRFSGADFGAQLQACVDSLSTSYGGTCDARNYTGVVGMASDVRIGTSNTTVLLPCATIASASKIVVPGGTRNVSLRGCALRGGSAADGSAGGTALRYSGSGAAIEVGDSTYAVDTPGFRLENVVVNTTLSTSGTARAFAAYRTQELSLSSVYFLGNADQAGMVLDGTGNYTGGTFADTTIGGYKTAVSGIGHQVENAATTDWLNASTFVRLHINCPISGGSPISGTVGIDMQQGDGNTILGGDVEGCATVLHLGAGAKNNTIVGLRNENSTNQVVADAGSAYNSWISGGTMFTGQLTDNGTRNSFLDTFHRSFNAQNGDWYGSQQDATVTNHYRLGTGAGNERGLMDRYQTDYGYRWLMGLSDATSGVQYYQVKDELNNVNRLAIGQYNAGQPETNNQTVINAAGTGAVVVNGSANSGTGGLVVGSGGTSGTTVATISNAGSAQFTGNLQVGGTTTFTGSTTVRNNADAEIDQFLWAGLTASQKESLTYKDYTGVSQWYLVKDASNNWALNSAVGGLDALKAYQSTNSGDTYLNAAKPAGVVRVNYENGSGTAFNVYGGNSSTLYASFAGTAAIKFPGLKSSSGHSCLQVDSSGWMSNTGSECGSGTGGSGTVSYGTTGQMAYYTDNGTQVGGVSAVPVTAGGTGAGTAVDALTNLGAVPLSGGTLTGALTGPSFVGTGTAPQFAGTATHAQNLAADFATQSAASPQAGTFTSVKAGSGILLKDGAGAVNVKAYGAVGDGSTNDTAAILSALASLTSGGSLYIPSGTYKFCRGNGGLLADTILASNVTVYGDGAASRIQGYKADCTTPNSHNNYYYNVFQATGRTGITIRDMSFSGYTTPVLSIGSTRVTVDGILAGGLLANAGGYLASLLVVIDGGSDVTVRNCRFENFMFAVMMQRALTGVTPTNIRIVNNHFENNVAAGSYTATFPVGVYSSYSDNVVISGNTFKNIYSSVDSGTTGTGMGYAIYEGDGASGALNITSNAIRYEAWGLKNAIPIRVSAAKAVLVNSNVFTIESGANAGTAVRLDSQNGDAKITVAGNVVSNANTSGYAFYLSGSGTNAPEISVAGNTVHGGLNAYRHDALGNARVAITGNEFDSQSDASIRLNGELANPVKHPVISGNRITRSGWNGIMLSSYIISPSIVGNTILDGNTTGQTGDSGAVGAAILFGGSSHGSFIANNVLGNTAYGGGQFTYGIADQQSTVNRIFKDIVSNNSYVGFSNGGQNYFRSWASQPTNGIFDMVKGDVIQNSYPSTGSSPMWYVVDKAKHSVTVDASSASTIVTVDSTSNMLAGDVVLLLKDSNPYDGDYATVANWHADTIASVTDSTHFVLTTGIPAGDGTYVGGTAVVHSARFKSAPTL